jgi:prevent-host-death family protein
MRSSPRTLRAKRSATVCRSLPAWKLQDAKAHFSQVVREAREQGPQRVTLRGKDAVVILSAEDYASLSPAVGSQAYTPCYLGRRCETSTSSTEASALQWAMSSCERLAPRYKRDLGVVQVELRRPGQELVGQSSPSEYVS